MAGHPLDRREFLRRAALAAPWVAGVACAPLTRRPRAAHELAADLVIIGGGLGGCAAALAAARNGRRVLMTEETDWIGGQLTQQAVPPDENRWIETIGGTRSYRALRDGIRAHYYRRPTLLQRARENPRLNPGNGWVSRLCCEPRAALAVLHEMLAPYLATGQVRLLLRHCAIAADIEHDRVRAVLVRHMDDGTTTTLVAPYFADATELGDLLPLTRTEYVTGAESRAQTGEPHAKEEPQPDNVQGFTMCFAMDYLAGEDHAIERPHEYAAWRDVVLTAANGAPYRLVSFEDADSQRIGFDPAARKGFWTYRRIIDRDLFAPGASASDITIVNWAQNDYSFGSLIDVAPDVAARHVERARQLSLSLLYWLQTEAPRPDGGAGWSGLRLRPDVVGTRDGLAMHPYIRESRRIQAEFTVLEQHVTTEARLREAGRSSRDVTAAAFRDSVGIGHYSMDLHLTTRGDRGRYGDTLPFQIPLGALIPQRVENLLPAAKNLGVTHLTNGCYRLHPVEWNVGEAVGSLAAFCLARQRPPRAVRATAALLQDFQAQLTRDGVPLGWPSPLPA
ncbi:MAG: FAD-dependent oxidoreductase [Gemmatimonadota bacterium]|nr:FAD-dependent oxidoreductase [Gemmatimonadota bacterium]